MHAAMHASVMGLLVESVGVEGHHVGVAHHHGIAVAEYGQALKERDVLQKQTTEVDEHGRTTARAERKTRVRWDTVQLGR